jgi:hypothetical protein
MRKLDGLSLWRRPDRHFNRLVLRAMVARLSWRARPNSRDSIG